MQTNNKHFISWRNITYYSDVFVLYMITLLIVTFFVVNLLCLWDFEAEQKLVCLFWKSLTKYGLLGCLCKNAQMSNLSTNEFKVLTYNELYKFCEFICLSLNCSHLSCIHPASSVPEHISCLSISSPAYPISWLDDLLVLPALAVSPVCGVLYSDDIIKLVVVCVDLHSRVSDHLHHLRAYLVRLCVPSQIFDCCKLSLKRLLEPPFIHPSFQQTFSYSAFIFNKL